MDNKKTALLNAYKELGELSEALIIAKVKQRTHYQWLEKDAEYAAVFAEAKQVIFSIKKKTILDTFRETGDILKSVNTADIHYDTHKRWIKKDSQYAAAFQAAKSLINANKRDKRKEIILGSYRKTGDILKACIAAKTATNIHYQWLTSDLQYAAAFEKIKTEVKAVAELKRITKSSLCWTCLRCGWDFLCHWPKDNNNTGKTLDKIFIDGQVVLRVLKCQSYWPDEAAIHKEIYKCPEPYLKKSADTIKNRSKVMAGRPGGIESDLAKNALRVYLSLGPSRTLQRVARLIGSKIRNLQNWSKKCDWKLQAAEYDALQKPKE